MDPPVNAPPPRVMLLALWCNPGQPWRARVVDAEARVHDFDSPFELARFLCAPAPPPTRLEGGLR